MALNQASPAVFTIPQSVLVRIQTSVLEVLRIRCAAREPQALAYWQSVTGRKHALADTCALLPCFVSKGVCA